MSSVPTFEHRLYALNGNTQDIMDAVRKMFADRAGDTAGMAASYDKGNVADTARGVFADVDEIIRYQLDPVGHQLIKSPARTLFDGEADCKGISILIASIFHNLGYNTGFRFAAYHPGPVTHVYAIVLDEKGKLLPVDPVLDAPVFSEKKFIQKIDFMTQISMLGNTGGRMVAPIVEIPPMDNMDDAELSLWIARGYRMAKAEAIEGIAGPDNKMALRIRDQIDFLEDAIDDVRSNNGAHLEMITEDAERGEYRQADELAGINGPRRRAKRKAKRAAKKAKRKADRARGGSASKPKQNRGLRSLIKKIKKGVKAAVKAVKKVGAAPARVAMALVLPGAAAGFLYLFIRDKAAIAKLPKKVRRKRKKQEIFAKFVINGLAMREDHFFGLLRTGIVKKFKKEPEKLLATYMRGGSVAGIDGIGFVDVAFTAIRKLIQLISKIAGKKGSINKNDMPDLANDFKQFPGARELAASVEEQTPDDFQPDEDENDNGGGGGSGDSESGDNGSGSSGGGGRSSIC